MSVSEDNYVGTEDNSGEEHDNENDDYLENSNEQQNDLENNSDGAAYDSDDNGREKNELELLRERNIKKANEFLQMLMNDPEYADVVATAKELKQVKVRKVRNAPKDPSFRSFARVSVPLVQRRSFRLQNIPPIFFKEDLIDETECNRKRKRGDDTDYYDLETVIYHPKKPRASSHNTVRTDIIPVEDVTDQMIENIARKGTIKVYSDGGTSCHQCRQKTKDQKTCCRNVNCPGVRGQFCGVCLENRYGEDVAVALKDPQWKCPVCRGICNCSFCRQRAGKRPTGILAPLAQQTGHKSVKDFLESLKGEGDYAHQDALWQKINNPKYLLGFSNNNRIAHMGADTKHEIEYFLELEKLNKYISAEANKLELIIDDHDQPGLLGFFIDTDTALMDDGTHLDLGTISLKKEVEQYSQTNIEINAGTLNKYIFEKEKELQSKIYNHDDPRNLLGFLGGTNIALLDDGTQYDMGPTSKKPDQPLPTKVELSSI